jgi:hypothetical protein
MSDLFNLVVLSLIALEKSTGKIRGTEGASPSDPLFFRDFPAHKSGGGDKGVGVDLIEISERIT